MSVALENARLFEETNRLLDETKQRAAELGIINSVQQGLAAHLDLDGIIELVGDKILEIVNSDTVGIGLLDSKAEVIRVPYLYDQGQRHTGEIPLGKGLASHVVLGKKTLLINEDMKRRAEELGAVFLGSQEIDKSWLGVPDCGWRQSHRRHLGQQHDRGERVFKLRCPASRDSGIQHGRGPGKRSAYSNRPTGCWTKPSSATPNWQ